MNKEHDHQSEFIRRRQKAREKTFLTRKNLLSLVLVSLLLCAAFVVWAGIPEGGMGLGELALFTVAMLMGVFLIALVGATLLLMWRKVRRRRSDDSLSVLLGDADHITDDVNE